MDSEKIKSEVFQTVKDMNSAWTKQPDAEKLRRYFHDDMVALVPTVSERVVGGDACVAGWMNFAASAKITKWEERDPLISLFLDGTVAVVSYYYDMTIEMNGHSISMNGRDLFTFINEQGEWKAISDQFSSFPSC